MIEIGRDLANDSKKNHEYIRKTGASFILTPKILKEKYPELLGLPDDLSLFKITMEKHKYGDFFSCLTMGIYRDDDNTQLFDVDFNLIYGCNFLKFKSGKDGYCDIEINNLILRVPVNYSDNYFLKFSSNVLNFTEPFWLDYVIPKAVDKFGNCIDITRSGPRLIIFDSITGYGKPPVEYLELFPCLEIPLYSNLLKERVSYEIINSSRKSRQYKNRPLYDLKNEQGDLIRNVIPNERLIDLFDRYGIGTEFSIVQRFENYGRWEIKIKDLLYPIDFSDLDTL